MNTQIKYKKLLISSVFLVTFSLVSTPHSVAGGGTGTLGGGFWQLELLRKLPMKSLKVRSSFSYEDNELNVKGNHELDSMRGDRIFPEMLLSRGNDFAWLLDFELDYQIQDLDPQKPGRSSYLLKASDGDNTVEYEGYKSVPSKKLEPVLSEKSFLGIDIVHDAPLKDTFAEKWLFCPLRIDTWKTDIGSVEIFWDEAPISRAEAVSRLKIIRDLVTNQIDYRKSFTVQAAQRVSKFLAMTCNPIDIERKIQEQILTDLDSYDRRLPVFSDSFEEIFAWDASFLEMWRFVEGRLNDLNNQAGLRMSERQCLEIASKIKRVSERISILKSHLKTQHSKTETETKSQ